MPYPIPNDGINVKIIDDTEDYLVPSLTSESGINGLILYRGYPSFQRDIKIEVRNASDRSALMVGLMDTDGVVLDGEQYEVATVTCNEVFGKGDTETIQVWTYSIGLVV